MNEFAPPSHEYDCSAFPSREGAYQFTLKSLIAAVTAMLTGGETAHRLAMSATRQVGGVQVDLSARGEAIYVALGCIGGTACVIGYCLLWRRLDRGHALCRFPAVRSNALFILFAVLAGIVGGTLIYGFSPFLFLFLPNNSYKLLTNPPQG